MYLNRNMKGLHGLWTMIFGFSNLFLYYEYNKYYYYQYYSNHFWHVIIKNYDVQNPCFKYIKIFAEVYLFTDYYY